MGMSYLRPFASFALGDIVDVDFPYRKQYQGYVSSLDRLMIESMEWSSSVERYIVCLVATDGRHLFVYDHHLVLSDDQDIWV